MLSVKTLIIVVITLVRQHCNEWWRHWGRRVRRVNVLRPVCLLGQLGGDLWERRVLRVVGKHRVVLELISARGRRYLHVPKQNPAPLHDAAALLPGYGSVATPGAAQPTVSTPARATLATERVQLDLHGRSTLVRPR